MKFLNLIVFIFLDHRHVRPQHLAAHVVVAEAVSVDLRVAVVSGEVLLLRRLHRRRPHRAQCQEIEGREEEGRDRQAEVDLDPLRGPGPGN